MPVAVPSRCVKSMEVVLGGSPFVTVPTFAIVGARASTMDDFRLAVDVDSSVEMALTMDVVRLEVQAVDSSGFCLCVVRAL